MSRHLDSAGQISASEDSVLPRTLPGWQPRASAWARRGGELLRRVRPLRAAVGNARELHRRLRPRVWELEGRERTSGERLAVLFYGLLESKNYLRQLIYGGSCQEKARGVWRWRLEQRLGDAGAGHGLAIAECTALPPAMPGHTFHIPCWIGGEIDLAEAARRRRSSGDLKQALRRVRKHRFHYTISRSPAAILAFYDEMYRPYVRATYGGHAFVEPRARLEARLDRSELLLVHQDGIPVAGQVTRYESGGAYAWLLGVRDGERRLVHDGVNAAIYHFTLQHLAEQGFERLDIGESRPFLNDGVLRYKAKWGLRLYVGTPRWFALTLLRPCAGAHAFLHNNPFVYQAHERLYGACFSPARSPRPAARALDALRIQGIAGITLFRGSGGSPGSGGWNPAGYRRWPS